MVGWRKRQKNGRMKQRREDWKNGWMEGNNIPLPFHASTFPPECFQFLTRMLIFIIATGMLLPSALFEVALAEESEESASPNGERRRTRDEQDRHIKIEIERQKMESAKRLMGKKKIEVEKLEAMMMEENNIVTVAEVNTAKEDYEKAVSDYEQAKLEAATGGA